VVAKFDGTVVRTNHYYPYEVSFAESTLVDKHISITVRSWIGRMVLIGMIMGRVCMMQRLVDGMRLIR